jgi:hypothetical protein
MIEWLHNLVDPLNLVTETIYNVTFELVATYLFVRYSMKSIVRKIVKEELEKIDE